MKVVIVGGGFGGVQAGLQLANRPEFEVRLISDKSYFEYHAALYRSATGRSVYEVAIPLADVFQSPKNVEVVEDRITSFDAIHRTLSSESESTYHFDAVIFALGSVPNYYNIQGLQEYSYGIYTIQEALEYKRHLHESFVNGQLNEKNFIIIGAGATGVEVAGELRAYINKVSKMHDAEATDFKIDLIEAAPRILSSMPESFSKKVSKRLENLGVTIHTDTKVEAETYDGLKLPNGEIKSRTVIWTAGTANNPFFDQYPAIFKKDKRGKIMVNEYLEAAPNVYVIGDSASTPYSGMAQTALHDANFVTNNLISKTQGHSLQKYQPKQPAYAIPVGPRWAGVLIANAKLFGYLGWLGRRFVDLKLYIDFLPLRKALMRWRYGLVNEEACTTCNPS